LNRHVVVVFGITVLVLVSLFSIALTHEYAECRNSSAVTYSDDLNPTAFEETTTFISCETEFANSNSHLLEVLGALVVGIVLLYLFTNRINSALPQLPGPSMQQVTKLNQDRRTFSTRGTNLDRAQTDGIAPSIIGPGVTMEGALRSEGDFQIEGNINGDVQCSNLYITTSGKVSGEIFAERILVQGVVRGTIHANEVILLAGGRVDGTIWQRTLQIEIGAHFTGDCRHSESPFANQGNNREIDSLSPSSPIEQPIKDLA
jgi:cytoskeletal protein CcmA (bactofilin family)